MTRSRAEEEVSTREAASEAVVGTSDWDYKPDVDCCRLAAVEAVGSRVAPEAFPGWGAIPTWPTCHVSCREGVRVEVGGPRSAGSVPAEEAVEGARSCVARARVETWVVAAEEGHIGDCCP